METTLDLPILNIINSCIYDYQNKQFIVLYKFIVRKDINKQTYEMNTSVTVHVSNKKFSTCYASDEGVSQI